MERATQTWPCQRDRRKNRYSEDCSDCRVARRIERRCLQDHNRTRRLEDHGLGNNTVKVLDLKNGSHLQSLPRFREPQGIAFAADAKIVAVANGQGEGLQFVDGGDYHFGKTVALGDDSDNVRYDATAKRLYTGYGGGALAAVDPTDGHVVGQVKLPGHPESFQLERNSPRIFVNVPSAEQIGVVDRSAMKIVATWPVTAARANYPMALDENNHRVFIGCRRPAKVLVYDAAPEIRLFDCASCGH